MSNLIDIANAIDILISQGRLKEKDSVEKAYVLVSANKQEFSLDFEFDMDDVKSVLRNKKKYRLDETFEMYKDVEPSEEFKDEEEVFKKKQDETKQIFKILYKLKKNKEIDITQDSASKIYKILSPLITTSMDKKEIKELIYSWGEVVLSEKDDNEEEEEDTKKVEKKVKKTLKKVEKNKLERDEKTVDYDAESVMKNIENIRRFADISTRLTLMKYISNEDRKFYIEYKKKMEEDKKKLSLLGSNVEREIKQVEEIKKKKGKKDKKEDKKEKEEEEEKNEYMKLLGVQKEEEKKVERKIIRKQMKPTRSDNDKADDYFTWFLDNPESTLAERINKVNEYGLVLLNKMEYFLKLPDRSQLFYAKTFKRAKENPSYKFYDNIGKYVKEILTRINTKTSIAKKKDLTKFEENMIKTLEEDTKNILEKNKEFEEYTNKVENTVLNSLENKLDSILKQAPSVEEAPRVEEKKVTEQDLEKHDDGDFLVELFTPQGTYFVWYSTIKQKAEKEGKKEEKKELGKFYDLRYQIDNVISTRSPADLLSISKENNKGFLYSTWAVNNQDATTAAHLNKITSLGLSPSLLGPLLRLDNETRNLFYYSIISKFRDQENNNAIYTWTFYGVLAEFLRNTNKKVYIEKLKASVKDLENLEEITSQEIDLLGEDIEDLFEEEQKNEIDDQDSVNDDIEELQENIEKSRFDINELISDFLEEKTEYKPNQNTELNFLSISFLKWLYYNYPSAPQFNAALIRDVFKDNLGKDRFFIGVKTLVSKSGEKRQLKIPYVKDIQLTEVLNTEETELVSKARNFINLATTYDSKSKLYMAFHMEAYKLSKEEDLDETITKYNDRFTSILKESFSQDFLKEYKNLWRKYNLKIKTPSDIPKITLEKLMNLTPYVQNFLKSKTKLLKNPLIINTNRRNNRKRLLNTKESVASRLLSKLPSNISSTVKECLLWNQTKPYWNLNYREDVIVIAQADGVTKEQMPENMRIFFGDFVAVYNIEDKPYYFYKPSRMYSLLQCHLTYNEKDIVQCRSNMDNSITLYTENLSLNIFTGIYNMGRLKNNEDVRLDDKYDKIAEVNKRFTLVTKSMYDKECKWWQEKTSSPSVIINKLKQMKMDSNEREIVYITKQIENNVEILLRNIVEEKDVDRVTKYVMNYLTKNKDKNVSKFVYDFVTNIYTISNIFYPGKIIKNYKSLWKLTPENLTQETINNLLSIPEEYKFIEIYSHPELVKREYLKQIFLDEISREVDHQIAYFYNSFYKDRPKIRAVDGRRIGYVSSDDPISIKIGDKIKTFQKGALFEDDVKCYNDLDPSYKGSYVKVRGIIINDEGEEEDKLICIRVSKIYDLYENNKRDEYYNTRIKISKDEFADVVIPRQIVNTVLAQVSVFDPLMYLKKNISEYIIYNGEFYNKNTISDYVCLNDYKGDKNRLIFIKVSVKTPDGKEEEEKMVCMDIMDIYNMYQVDYNKNFYETVQYISPDVSLAIKIPRETVNIIKTHVDNNKTKYSFDSGYRFDNIEDVHLFCNYCKKVIESEDTVLKSYEQQVQDNQVITRLMLYCGTNCFNNYNESMPKLKEKYSHKHNMDQDIKKRMHLNFMLKVLNETKIPSYRLSYLGYTSVSDLKRDVLNGKVSLSQFVSIMGEKQMEKYKNVLYYLY